MREEMGKPESSSSFIKNSNEYKELLEKNNRLELDLKDLNKNTTEKTKNEEVKEDFIPKDKILRVAFARHILKNKIKEKGESYARQSFRRQNSMKLKCCFEYHEVVLNQLYYNHCPICYTSYKIDKNNKLIPHIEKKFIIKNEKELIDNHTCKRCKKSNITTYNKICNFCSKFEKSVDILDTSSEDEKNVNLFKKYSEKTINSIRFYDNLYDIAIENKIDVHTKNPFIEFVKNNNYHKYQSGDTIWKKVNRCRYISEMYNHKDYQSIETNLIKIDINFITKLNSVQWEEWKRYFLTYLDNFLTEEEEEDNDDDDNYLEFDPNEILNE
ncbi:hypothetical protein BY458DRAFT_530810 [Sporodiniella umbellata]|nr:hypothetical protein BY458DRAFT_530810 [Sporodiniella umbellata]